MNKFRYKISLMVEVEAFDEADAWDAIQDSFGIGETGAVVVKECVYKEVRSKKR